MPNEGPRIFKRKNAVIVFRLVKKRKRFSASFTAFSNENESEIVVFHYFNTV